MELCIKALAVVLTVGAVSAAYGRETILSAFAENKTAENRILDKNENDGISAIAKTENTVLRRQEMSILRGDHGDLPFLVRSIKYKCREEGDCLCFYNSNQIMLFNISTNICVYFSYSCEIGDPKFDASECMEEAKRGVYSAFSHNGAPNVTECNMITMSDKVCTFLVKTDKTMDSEIEISVRRDTCNIVLFDALSVNGVSFNLSPYGNLH